jgi:hypothetical protein
VEAEQSDTLASMIELVALLNHQPPVPLPPFDPDATDEPCDASILLAWLRGEVDLPTSNGLRREVQRSVRRLSRALGVEPSVGTANRRKLLGAVLRADPRSAHVARQRGRKLSFGGSGTEVSLGRESWANLCRGPEALVVLDSLAIGTGSKRSIVATRASAVPLSWLAEAGLGEDRVQQASLKRGQLTARVERVYAGRVIDTSERPVEGAQARLAITRLYLEGRWFPGALKETRRRLSRWKLASVLTQMPGFEHYTLEGRTQPAELEVWAKARIEELGVESGEDLQLLSEQDLIAEDVPAQIAPKLEEEFPLEVNGGGCVYAVEYDVKARQVLLSIVRGLRTTPPPAHFLPAFRGFRVCVEAGGRLHVVRERRR